MKKENSKLLVQNGTQPNEQGISIEVIENGPYEVHGAPKLIQQFIIANEHGISVKYKEGKQYEAKEGTHLCRCGLSKNKPYCDGSHHHAEIEGINLKETATKKPLLSKAEEFAGPVVSVTDNEDLCAFARFCDQDKKIWREVESKDPKEVDLTIKMAHQCPSGRLIAWDNETEKPIETKLEPMVGIIEDPRIKSSGPLALNGGIPVTSADGTTYEVRNRQTLCRCGLSCNKPFCNGAHASARFKDGLPTEPEEDGKEF